MIFSDSQVPGSSWSPPRGAGEATPLPMVILEDWELCIYWVAGCRWPFSGKPKPAVWCCGCFWIPSSFIQPRRGEKNIFHQWVDLNPPNQLADLKGLLQKYRWLPPVLRVRWLVGKAFSGLIRVLRTCLAWFSRPGAPTAGRWMEMGCRGRDIPFWWDDP